MYTLYLLQGMDSGFGDDEAYNVYDKAWRQDQGLANHLYRPSRNKDNDTYGDDLDNIIKTNRSVVGLKRVPGYPRVGYKIVSTWVQIHYPKPGRCQRSFSK